MRPLGDDPRHLSWQAISALAWWRLNRSGELAKDPAEVYAWRDEGGGAAWKKDVLSGKGSHDIRVADLEDDGLPDVIGANHGGEYRPIELWRDPGRRDR